MFIQCTSDPIEGPQGIAGVDGYEGVDGLDGADGASGTASCVACHSNSHKESIETAFAKSEHAKVPISAFSRFRKFTVMVQTIYVNMYK